MKFDVVSLGELLVDATPMGKGAMGNPAFEMNPGGAPANVVCALARLGRKTAYITKVGRDAFGDLLQGALEKEGVDCGGLRRDDNIPTTMAIVHLNDHGDRSFAFYRKPGADILLTADEVDVSMLADTRIFHFGSLSLTDQPCRDATLRALEAAKKNRCIISYDPNLRPRLWKSLDEAKEQMLSVMDGVQICKLSDEELTFLTGQEDLEKGSQILLDRYGFACLVITLGPKGCYYRCGDFSGHVAAYDVPVVDTTGAGDCFVGALLSQWLDGEIKDQARLDAVMDFCSAASSLATGKRGAIPAMPTPEEVARCQKDVPKYIP